MDRLDPRAVDRLTPSPADAVDGMRDAFLDAFRAVGGPGSRRLACVAWAAWRADLLSLRGIVDADRSAVDAACTELQRSPRTAWRLWITEARLERATEWASAVARAER